MTSKEAINELIEGAKNDLNKWELDRLCIIDKDLEVLEILKKSIYNKTSSKYSLFTEFLVIDLFIKGNNDVAKVKEWLENDD